MGLALSFLGGAGSVTGSKYLLDDGNRRMLVDCGLFQGLKALRLKNWAQFPVDPRSLDAVILTHAHIDHSGYLPRLVKQGFKGRVSASSATIDLCKILLPDAGYLQEKDAEFANRHGFSKHKPALPLFTREDALDALNHLTPVAFDQDQSLPGGAVMQLRRSGHILGAASVRIRWAGITTVFSGDLGRGFQASGTRGAAMVAGAESIKMHGEYVSVRAQVSNLDMLSAHADADELLRWLRGFKEAPRMTFITHGEPVAADALRHRIEEELNWSCLVPDHGQRVEFG